MYIAQGFEWASHQPLINAILDLYDPKFVLELGVGMYSTPLFRYRNAMFIENDKEWIEKMEAEFGVNIHYHETEINDFDLVDDLTEDQREDLIRYYVTVKIPELKPNLLFVDNMPSCRVIAIKSLKHRFDIVMFHDFDEVGFKANKYNLIETEGFNLYSLQTNLTGTGVMIRKEIDKGGLAEAVESYKTQFMIDYPLCTKMYIQNL